MFNYFTVAFCQCQMRYRLIIIALTITSCAGGRHNMPRTCKLTFDHLTLKVVSASRVTWATSVPILVSLGLSVLDLGSMYATDRRQTSDRQTSDSHNRLMPPTLRAGDNNRIYIIPYGRWWQVVGSQLSVKAWVNIKVLGRDLKTGKESLIRTLCGSEF